MKLFLLLLPYLSAGLVYTALAILIERVMIWLGWARGNAIPLAILCFFFSMLFELDRFPKPASFDTTMILLLSIMSPFGINKYDLWTTMNKGRWWWKMSNEAENEKR